MKPRVRGPTPAGCLLPLVPVYASGPLSPRSSMSLGECPPPHRSPWLTTCQQMPLSGLQPLGVAASLSPCLCLCLLLPCLAFLGHTCLCLFSFLGGGSLQISPAVFVLLPGPHLSPLVFTGCLCLSGEISVSLSASQMLHRCLAAHLSVCLDLLDWVWVSAAPLSLFLKASVRLHLQPPSSASPSPHLSASPGPPAPPPHALQPGPVLSSVCLPRRPAEEVEGGDANDLTSPSPTTPPFPFSTFPTFPSVPSSESGGGVSPARQPAPSEWKRQAGRVSQDVKGMTEDEMAGWHH